MPNAIVLGGSAGIGRAIVDALVERGHSVGVVARGRDRLAALEGDHAGRVTTASADVGDAAALSAAVDTLMADGAPTIWVNCAMATSFSRFAEMEVEEFDRIVRTTFLGQVNGMRLALKHMTRGNIVCVGSGLGYRPVPGQSAYCASKHAIDGFVGSVRSELLKSRPELSLGLVQLPAHDTPQFTWARNRLSQKPQPAPPVHTPQVAARAVMKAIDTNARELLVGMPVFKLVFGDMVLPGYIDRKLAKVGIDMQKSGTPEPGGRSDNLFGPVDHASTPSGGFDGEIKDNAITLDADLARKLVFGGVVAIAFVLGLLIG